jgi:geranylgeranyl pyrophosphate synthase
MAPEIDPAGTPEWLEQLPEDVFVGALALVRKWSQSEAQEAALMAAIEPLRPKRGRGEGRRLLLALPSLVYAALGGESDRVLPVTIATALLARGVDILDDLADGDRPSDWKDYSSADLTLVATDLCCALAALSLDELDAEPSTILSLKRTLARGFLRASSGQRKDFAATGQADVTAADVIDSAAGKAGAFIAVLTRLPAELAQAGRIVTEACEQFGEFLGTAISIREDCDDLFASEWSRDLQAGTRSYPIAFHLQRQKGASHAEFTHLLDRARRDRVAQLEVRRQLVATGVDLHSNIAIALQCERADRTLTLVKPREPAAGLLRALLDAVPGFWSALDPVIEKALGSA